MSLADLRPDLIKFWSEKNEYSPWEISPSSHTECCWLCPECGCVFKRSCYSRLASARCKDCGYKLATGKQATPKYKESLGYLYPDIASTWSSRNTCTSFEVYPQSNTPKRLWICEYCGEEYSMKCSYRSKGSIHRNCSYLHRGLLRQLPTPFHSFADLYPDLLKEYSTENDRNPYSLRPGSHELVQWMCKKEHTWTAHIYARTGSWKTGCPHCSDKSKAENNLRAAFTQYGAENFEHKLGKWNVDIYFPDSKTVIEYDGSRWHSFSGAWDRDRRKSLELLEKGYTVIRIRTWSNNYKLESLNIDNENYTEVFCKEPKDSVPSEELVEELINILRNF